MKFARVATWRNFQTNRGATVPVDTGINHIVASANEAIVWTACRTRLPADRCAFEVDRSTVPVCWVCEGKKG